jgi:hypothetical protein
MSTAALCDYKCARLRFFFFFSSVIGWSLEKRGISNVGIIERPGKYIAFDRRWKVEDRREAENVNPNGSH